MSEWSADMEKFYFLSFFLHKPLKKNHIPSVKQIY